MPRARQPAKRIREALGEMFPGALLERDPLYGMWAANIGGRHFIAALFDEEGMLGALVEVHPKGDESCGGYVSLASHRTPTEGWREGRVRTEREGPFWTVEQASPLTLSPSLQCTQCPSHGHIREGRWV